ncbi:MAG: ABC transporter permease [Anaerolineae bacterium]|nr:ABC transporter permease [Anaerolineae bacterium]
MCIRDSCVLHTAYWRAIMAWNKLWVMAWRDLGRNRRRSLVTLIAVALGLALLMAVHGLVAGVVEDTMQNAIRLETGHVQIRVPSYEQEKASLEWKDLLENAAALAARAAALPEVKAAAPVLWAAAVLNTGDESSGVRIYGIDATSAVHEPVQRGLVAGEYLTPDDRNSILIGKHLADNLGLKTGDKASLVVIGGDGRPVEGVFAIRGIFATGVPAYDDTAVFMTLDKAQAFVNTPGRASAVVILLHRQNDADKVAAALRTPGTAVLTWRQLNEVFLQTMQAAMGFYVIMDLVVMLVVAVLIANTLLMAVFERIREMGILAALGMKGRHIMAMFLLEAATLGLIGIAVGVVLGSAGVAYLSQHGLYIGDMSSTASGMAVGTTMNARFDPPTFASLAFWTLIIVLLAALYPAWFAARQEPVDALRAL